LRITPVPPIILAFGTPRASVSPSAAPVRVKLAVEQVAGFKAARAGLNKAERCFVIAVPPPMTTDPFTF